MKGFRLLLWLACSVCLPLRAVLSLPAQESLAALDFLTLKKKEWSPERLKLLRRRGRIVGLVLRQPSPSLQGLELPFAFPFPSSCSRIEVWEPPGGRGLLLFSAGVREDLWVHVIRKKGSSFRGYSRRIVGGRLPPLRFAPMMDRAGETLSFVFEDLSGIHCQVFGFSDRAMRVLFSRKLESLPKQVHLQTALQDPWVQVRADGARWRGPGEKTYRESSFKKDRFLHPLAQFPIPSHEVLDLGGIAEDGRGSIRFWLENPGSLPLPLQWSFPKQRGWTLSVKPQAGTLRPGEKRFFILEVEDSGVGGKPRLELGMVARSPSGGGDPLVEIPVRAFRTSIPDRTPPELNPKRIRLFFASGMRIGIHGLEASVQDSHPPIRVGGAGGKEVVAERDGSFRMFVPRIPDGRILLWTQDSLGNRSRPILVGRLLDQKPPRWDPSKVRLSLPAAGTVQVFGSPGALQDETPPLELEVKVDGRVLPKSFQVRRDGSFRIRMKAKPGQRISLLARDSSVPSRRSPPLPVGIVLPYWERSGPKQILLHGPPFAPFELLFRVGKARVLKKKKGLLNASGMASFERSQENWELGRIRVQDPASERWYVLKLR